MIVIFIDVNAVGDRGLPGLGLETRPTRALGPGNIGNGRMNLKNQKKMTGFDWDLTANDRCKFSDLAQP